MAAACAMLVAMAALGAPSPRADEFIRVAPDNWHFVGAQTGRKFIPFGTNFVFADKKYLNLFAPEVYDRRLYERALAALEALGMNIVKVFLPIADVLPDPQRAGAVNIAPGYLENLADFLALARRHNIRVVVALASWGGNSIRWWHEGGQYFGRKPWRKDDGIDSLDVLRRFWTELCGRFCDDPTIFAWTPAVEWSLPNGNLTWIHPKKQWGRVDTEPGLWYWRAFLRARYGGDIVRLNRAYGTNYRDFDEVPLVDYTWLAAERRYADPDAKILDYQNFREWASMRYLRPQIEAIRAADPNHMVTISNHSRQAIGLWPGAARYFMGFEVPEQAELVDYYTFHNNVAESKLRPGQDIHYVVRQAILRARYCTAAKLRPVMMEEFTYGAPDPRRVAECQAEMVLGTVGHVMGWMNWYMQYPLKPNSADTPPQDRSAILDEDLSPTPWGLRAKQLIRRLEQVDLSRKPPATTMSLDRMACLVPKAMGPLLVIPRDWDKYEHPIDFDWPRNEFINLRLIEER